MGNRRNNDNFFYGGGDGFPGPNWGQQALFAAQIPNLPMPGMGDRGFNPFAPMVPNWGAGGYWDQQNAQNHQRGMMSQQQAPQRDKIALLQSLLSPNGALGKFLGGLGGLGGPGGMGVMTGFQSTNSPQSAGLLSGLGR